MCLFQVLHLWPHGQVCVWALQDQKTFSYKAFYFTVLTRVYFGFLSCLFALMGAAFSALVTCAQSVHCVPPPSPLGASDDGGISF